MKKGNDNQVYGEGHRKPGCDLENKSIMSTGVLPKDLGKYAKSKTERGKG